MSISTIIRRLQELAELKEQFPDVEVALTGLGYYAPKLTEEQWERYYGVALANREFAKWEVNPPFFQRNSHA